MTAPTFRQRLGLTEVLCIRMSLPDRPTGAVIRDLIGQPSGKEKPSEHRANLGPSRQTKARSSAQRDMGAIGKRGLHRVPHVCPQTAMKAPALLHRARQSREAQA